MENLQVSVNGDQFKELKCVPEEELTLPENPKKYVYKGLMHVFEGKDGILTFNTTSDTTHLVEGLEYLIKQTPQ